MERTTADLLRLMAMTAVCAIHAADAFSRRFAQEHQWLSQDVLAMVVEQLGRFCVPIFVVLSGFGLMARQRARPLATRHFFYDRWLRLGLPYLTWSIGLVLAATLLGGGDPVAAAVALPGHLLRGSADYHLYFFPIIIGCSLCFPLLARLGPRLIWLLPPLLLWQVLMAQPTHRWLALAQGMQTALPAWIFLHWLGYFTAGMVLAQRPPQNPPRWAALSVLALAAAGVLGDWLYWSYRLPDTGWYNHFFRLSVIGYAAAVWWAMASMQGTVARWFRAPAAQAWLAKLAGWSFTVFLVHTWLLRGLQHTPLAHWFVPLVVVLLALGFGLAALADRCLPWRWPRLLLGLPDPAKQRAAAG